MQSQNMSQSPYPSGGPVQPPYQQAMPPSIPQPGRPSSGAWTPADDARLMAARAQGLNWAPIQSTYFPSKTPNACRKRHERLMDRRNSDDWDTIKLENLAKEYMGMRREMWSQLGAKTGEKWNVVEAKCMASGVKNLQSHARACSRRERLESSSGLLPVHHPEQDVHGGYGDPHADDSGISLDDQDAEYYHHSHGHSHHHSLSHSADSSTYGRSAETASYGGQSGSLSLSPDDDQIQGQDGRNIGPPRAVKLYPAPSPGLALGPTGMGGGSSRGYDGYAQQQSQQQMMQDPRSGQERVSDPRTLYDGRDGGYSAQQQQQQQQQVQGQMRPTYGMQNRLPSIDMGIGAIINPTRVPR